MSLRVIEPGLHSLLVDFGRPGSRSLGVAVGGAADRTALAIGNALVGNAPTATALEVALSGPVLQADASTACVVYGARFEIMTELRRFQAGKSFTLATGEILQLGGTSLGMHAYLCVRGGFESKRLLGSCSGLEPVKAGETLRCGPSSIPSRFVNPSFTWNLEPHALRITEGNQAGWFQSEELLAQEFTIAPSSNRIGLRLRGDSLTWPDRQMISEPVCPGTVQVTPDGQCIILGIDCQAIGGYPKIAQVISADIDKLAQLCPLSRVQFRRVTIEEAEAGYKSKMEEVHEWLLRIRAVAGSD